MADCPAWEPKAAGTSAIRQLDDCRV